jgi:hypothetical protein
VQLLNGLQVHPPPTSSSVGCGSGITNLENSK